MYYDYSNHSATYVKVGKVIVSCRTTAQLYTALRYVTLFVKQLQPSRRKQTTEWLNNLIRKQRLIIRLHGEKKKK